MRETTAERRIDADKFDAHTRRMAKKSAAKSTAASAPVTEGENMNADYYWANDPYWIDALHKYGELKEIGKRQIVIDLEKLTEVVYDGEGPAYKLMDAMVSVKEKDGMEGFRGAPRVLLALLMRLEELSEAKEPTRPSQTASAGFMAALDQASKPNYLGDPEVVGNLLRKYRDMAVESRNTILDPEERLACDHGYALGMAEIFLGKSPAYAPIIPWNSPGQIDRWIASELHRPGFEGETPEQIVANAMLCYLQDNFDLAKALVQSPKTEEWANAEMEKIDTRYVHLFLGIPYQEKKSEPTDDELCEEDDEP